MDFAIVALVLVAVIFAVAVAAAGRLRDLVSPKAPAPRPGAGTERSGRAAEAPGQSRESPGGDPGADPAGWTGSGRSRGADPQARDSRDDPDRNR